MSSPRIALLPETDVVSDIASGGSMQRILVPVDATGRAADAVALARMSCAVNGTVRLVHVRIFDPPVRNFGRFFPESRDDAAAVVEGALLAAWAWVSKATGDVVIAERSRVAQAIVTAARNWDSGVIVMARRPRRAVTRLLTGSVADAVLRRATCPVLVTRPGLR